MSRRRAVTKRKVLPEPKYADVALAKFINVVMNDGKKSVAEKIVYGALDRIAERGGVEPLEIFKQAVENVRPLVEIKSRRVGGATYQIPIEVRPLRSTALAMRWIVAAARRRDGRSMGECLAGELAEAAEQRGGAFKKREDTHKMAEANKAFAHYRW